MGLSNNLGNNLSNKLAATMPFHAFHAITTPVAVLGKLGTATPQLRLGVIAELGTSHMGSLSHAKESIAACQEAGANAVKVQIVFASEILHPSTQPFVLEGNRVNLLAKFRQLERGRHFYAEMQSYAQKLGIVLMASFFGLGSYRIARSLNFPVYKLASPESHHMGLWRAMARSSKPVLVSLGMTKASDVAWLAAHVRGLSMSGRVMFMHCITRYPAPEQQYNVAAIIHIMQRYGMAVGLSCHGRDAFFLPTLAASLFAQYFYSCVNNNRTNNFSSTNFNSNNNRTNNFNSTNFSTNNYPAKAGQDANTDADENESESESESESEKVKHMPSILFNEFVVEKHVALSTNHLDEKVAITPRQLTQLIKLMQEAAIFSKEFSKETAEVEAEKQQKLWLPDKNWVQVFCNRFGYQKERVVAALGSGSKSLAPCEKPFYKTTNRSFLARHNIAAGMPITLQNTSFVRCESGKKPGMGYPFYRRLLAGDRFLCTKNIKAGDPITKNSVQIV